MIRVSLNNIYFMKFQLTIMPICILKQCSMGFRNKLSNLCKSVSLDKGSSTCSSYYHMTDECRSARNKIAAARKRYREKIRSATQGDLVKYTILWTHIGCLVGSELLIFLVFCVVLWRLYVLTSVLWLPLRFTFNCL